MADGACASLICDNCRLPGRCCTGFGLNAHSLLEAKTPLHALVWLATAYTGAVSGRTMLGLPFLPLWKEPRNGVWRFWCPLLTREGRCSDYENRPLLCRDYAPGSDQICAMHVPAPKAGAA